MTEFKPYKPEDVYKVEVSHDELVIIEKMRQMKYGHMTVHFVNGKPIRTETTNSELIRDAKGGSISVAYEVVVK